MAVSVLSINVVTVLFINCAVLVKRCFTGTKTSLCELVWCAGEESVGLYMQIAIVKHPQPLTAVFFYNSFKSNSTIVLGRMCCDYVCDTIDLFKSKFQITHLCYRHFISLYLSVIFIMELLK